MNTCRFINYEPHRYKLMKSCIFLAKDIVCCSIYRRLLKSTSVQSIYDKLLTGLWTDSRVKPCRYGNLSEGQIKLGS